MKILYIYRSKDSGPSIRRVFEPIAFELSKDNIVTSLFLPFNNASLSALWNNINYVKDHLHKNSYDVIHITGDVYYLLWFLRKYKIVVTVHDFLFYTRIKKRIKKRLMFVLELYPLRFAEAITFISQSSRNEALSILNIDSQKTSVIRNPINPDFHHSIKNIPNEIPIILHIGTKPNKNLIRVIEALKDIRCKLHIIGPISPEVIYKIQSLAIDAEVDSSLTDEQILKAYQECDIVSFPSLYEGFGMPIIEGQMVGRVVVTSSIEPMKTVSGGAAIFVNPKDIDSIRNGFLLAMKDTTTIINNGFINANRYSVLEICHEYLRLYQNVLDL